MKSTTQLVFLLTIAAVVMTGCQSFRDRRAAKQVAPEVIRDPTPSSAFVSPLYRQLRPHRVAIVTPANRMQEFHEQDQFAESLAVALREHGVFEAVVGAEVRCNLNAIQSGHFDEQQLVNLAAMYNADAILYCDVISMSAYDPLQASVALSIVDARESVVLFCSDGNWNMRDPNTKNAFRNFLQSGGYDYATESRLESPSDFMEYVADSTAKFIGQH